MKSSIDQSEHMTNAEIKATGGLSLIFAFRMLGMFMVLPVMSLYGMQLQGATPLLIGLAIGAYGYTQALLQIPLGMLSDRIGRMPIILIGLGVFLIGSLVAALSDSIYGVITGRILQGMGAISGAIMAMLSDLTRDQHRTKAMAFLGLSICFSFALAMIIGPIIAHQYGLHGLFYFIAMMALIGIVIMLCIVPQPKKTIIRRDASVHKHALWSTLKNIDLLHLNLSITLVHIVMMANFMTLPYVLINQLGLAKSQHWWVYLIAFLGSFIGMVPLIIYGEKKRQIKRVLTGCVATLIICSLFFAIKQQALWLLIIGIMLFFVAFNIIEALLPSMVSKVADVDRKGTAMGIFSSCQFFGAAVGASIGGVLLNYFGVTIVFLSSSLLCLIWLCMTLYMKEPPYVTSIRLTLPQALIHHPAILAYTLQQQGVSEAFVAREESAIYVKLDKKIITPEQLETTLLNSAYDTLP